MPRCAILATNEDETVYFMEVRYMKTIVSNISLLMNNINKKRPSFKSIKGKPLLDYFETKSYQKQYTGALY